MPLSRSPRMDRRRRAIRENLVAHSENSDEARVSPSRTARTGMDQSELTKRQRGVAYSHSVRRACQHRLVQFIPVRKLSLTGAVAASALVPILLMTLHYLVFVSGTLDWSGHPMSALLNANSPRSLAAWLSSHLWLLCLAATVLTFRLRKHKLDDYEGEYRLWFWLVFTCVIGSVDSTTRLTELFGAALDRWSQLHVGWSGQAIVQASLATLIGMLGLRLCSELKAVPTSLVLWLLGLLCWAGSAALSQSLLKLDISVPARAWMRASLWMSGLTAIWLCGLFYLRATFMEAQKRFLSRAMSTGNALPWQQRLREAMPSMPTMPSMPRFGRARSVPADGLADGLASEAGSKRRKKPRVEQPAERYAEQDEMDDGQPGRNRESTSVRSSSTTNTKPTHGEEAPVKGKRGWGFGLGGLALRPPTTAHGGEHASTTQTSPTTATRVPSEPEEELQREYGKRSNWFGRRTQKEPRADNSRNEIDQGTRADANQDQANKRSLRDRFTWKRKELTAEQQSEKEAQQAAKSARRNKTRSASRDDQHQEQAEHDDAARPVKKGSWLKLPKPRMPKLSLPKARLPSLPKLKLPSFRLPPPGQPGDEQDQESANTRVPSVGQSRPLPSTSGPRPTTSQQEQESENARNLSKAERKRLKRMQRDDEGDRRAA